MAFISDIHLNSQDTTWILFVKLNLESIHFICHSEHFNNAIPHCQNEPFILWKIKYPSHSKDIVHFWERWCDWDIVFISKNNEIVSYDTFKPPPWF